MSAYDNLRQRKLVLKEQFGDKFSKLDRLASLELAEDLINDLSDCISSEEDVFVIEGLNFLKGIMLERKLADLPNWFIDKLVARIRALIESKSKGVVYAALDWFVALRERYPDFRDIMLRCLNSEDVGRREYGLKYYESFARPGEYEPLLSFENDHFACQVGHAGDWEYELRDKAFLLIEKYSGGSFKKARLREPFEGAIVSWFDWAEMKVG